MFHLKCSLYWQTKNGKPHTVALPSLAAEIIKSRFILPNKHSVYVFSGNSKLEHFTDPKSAWKRILQRAGIHDLRRTLGSYQAITGASLPIIGKSLGHKTSKATEIYSKLTLDPVREAMKKAVDLMFLDNFNKDDKE